MAANRLLRTLVHAARFIHTLGVVEGTNAFVSLHVPGNMRTVRLSGYRAPMALRPRSSDTPVFEQVIVRCEYDLKDLHTEPAVIVDAGANIGLSSVWFATRYPGARILAIEPDLDNLRLLRRNTAPYPAVEVRHAALWPRTERLTLTNPTGESWMFQVRGDAPAGSGLVDGMTMHEVVAWAGGHVDLLKIDIEGAEREVFGAEDTAWLDHVGAIVIEPHDWLVPGCCLALYRALAEWEFDQFIYGEHLFIRRRLAS